MKALVKYAPGMGNVEIRDVPEPTPGPGEVKCEVEFCGICGTDIHIYNGHYKEPPLVMGHEWSGTVVETGLGVESVKAGDRVTGIPLGKTCGKCRYCLDGHPFMCSIARELQCAAERRFCPVSAGSGDQCPPVAGQREFQSRRSDGAAGLRRQAGHLHDRNLRR